MICGPVLHVSIRVYFDITYHQACELVGGSGDSVATRSGDGLSTAAQGLSWEQGHFPARAGSNQPTIGILSER